MRLKTDSTQNEYEPRNAEKESLRFSWNKEHQNNDPCMLAQTTERRSCVDASEEGWCNITKGWRPHGLDWVVVQRKVT